MDGYNQLKELETLLLQVKNKKASLDEVMPGLGKFSSKFFAFLLKLEISAKVAIKCY